MYKQDVIGKIKLTEETKLFKLTYFRYFCKMFQWLYML